MSAPVTLAHSHTVSTRLARGEEVLIVRVLTPDRVAGFGFTFRDDVAAARAMACWDAAARAAGLPLWRLLHDRHPDALEALEQQAPPPGHAWSDAWRAQLAEARANHGSREAPGAGIDWTLEPGFTTLHWIEPEPNGELDHG